MHLSPQRAKLQTIKHDEVVCHVDTHCHERAILNYGRAIEYRHIKICWRIYKFALPIDLGLHI